MKSINKILNVGASEWSRIFVSWSMLFLSRFGFIVGWSVLMASFLSNIGIEKLPLLFLANAFTVMLGTVFYRQLIHRVRRELLITFTVLSAAALLLASILFLKTQIGVFFGILIVVESVFVSQLLILISLFNEDLFSPLESQRTFPIIESAETLGGITGGLVLSLLASQVAPYKFVILWALALILIVPIVLKYNTRTMTVPKIAEMEEKRKKKSLRKTLKDLKNVPFLKGLMLIVLLHWSVMNVVEFQYTKAIQQEVYDVHEETIVNDESAIGIILANEGHTDEQILHYEQQITKKLGSLHAIFNGAALLIQLLLASRIITRLGVISSLLIHPIVTLLNMVGLTLKFGFNSAVLTRGSYELTGIIFKNAYDSSYYAVPHSERDEVKELMQGIVKPIGALLGTASILIISLVSTGYQQTFLLNTVLILMGLLMALVIAQLHSKYTEMSESNLSKKKDLSTRLNAIEILGQRGHLKLTSSLHRLLRRKGESHVLKERILYTLGQRKKLESISAIMEMLQNKDEVLRLAAVNALFEFTSLKNQIRKRPFTLHRIIDALKKRLVYEENDLIREQILRCFHEFAPEQLSAYIINSIQNNSSSALIRMLRVFPDPNLKFYLEPYLSDKSYKLKAASIIALWQFTEMRKELVHHIENMLNSNKKVQILEGIRVCGQIQFKDAKDWVRKHLFSEDKDLHDAAVLSLAQLEDKGVMQHLIALMANPEHEWFHKTEFLFKQLSHGYAKQLKRAFHEYIHRSIHRIISVYNEMKTIEEETLNYLSALYQKVHAHHESSSIKKLLDSLEK